MRLLLYTFITTTLFFVARPAAIPASTIPRGFRTVIIDPGHGGIDRGGVPGQKGISEKVATLGVATELYKILRAKGINAVMTRVDDTFISLGQRVASTNGELGRAIFVSIHFNSAAREGACGIETYFYRPDSFGLATRLHRSLVGTLKTDNRGIRRRGFFVIRNARIPAVLCECGFLTNCKEEKCVENGGYRKKIAQAIAAGILDQRAGGDPAGMGTPPPITSEHLGGASHHRTRHHRSSKHSKSSSKHSKSKSRH